MLGSFAASMDRYITVQEPTCTWAVFDTLDDVPAEVGGKVLVGLEKAAASALAASANNERALRMQRALTLGHIRLVA
jgi:hypothetical protein